ncbi:MAG TPA: hypothetical protein VM901_04185 [Bdellovibrionota bacterium]|nr:hypothetical protein [Bdellovibrionota bacterium]
MASPSEILSPPPMYVYFLYANFALLCVAITVGVIILLRRQATKDQMTGVGDIDYPKIASQIQREIVRLQELRDRIYPEGAADAAIEEASRPAVGSGVQGASLASMSAEDLRDLPEVQKILSGEIEKLQAKHAEALAAASSAAAGPGASEVAQQEIVGLKAEIEKLRKQAAAAPAAGADEGFKKLEGEVKELKDRLQEYEIFEEDLSRVKELSRENEELKKQLAALKAGGAVAATSATAAVASSAVAEKAEIAAAVTEAVAQSSETVRDASLSAGGASEAEESVDEGAIEAAIEAGATTILAAGGESEETSADSVTAEFEKLLSGGATSAPAPSAAAEVPKDFETEKVAEEPGISAAGDADSTVVPGDDLMAEFEKLLGTVDKES